jgi:hypothetical protein
VSGVIVLSLEEAREAIWAIQYGASVEPTSPAQERVNACLARLAPTENERTICPECDGRGWQPIWAVGITP